MKTETKPIVRYITMVLLGAIFAIAFCAIPCSAQDDNKEPQWIETQSAELPYGVEVFSGITRNGNPKYWFDIEGIKVMVSPTNAEKYRNEEVIILLVEWYNKTTDKYKYTTRQKKNSVPTKRVTKAFN